MMSDSNNVSNCTKFKILVWKNYKLQCARKTELVISTIILLLVFVLLFFGRYFIKPVVHEAWFYKPQDIDDFPKSLSHIDDFKKKLLYSPKSEFYEEIVSSAAKKISIDEFEGYKDETHLNMELLKENYFAGIKFTSDNTNSKSDKFAFELRFPAKIRSDIFQIATWDTDKLSPNLLAEAYIKDGFVQLQNALAMSYLEKVGNTKINLPNIKVNRFPENIKNTDILHTILELFPVIFLICYYNAIMSVVTEVAQERETQIKEIMIIIGLRNWLHWCAWFAKAFIIFAIISILMVLLLKIKFLANGAIFSKSDAFALLFVLLAYSTAVIVFSFAIAVCFKRSIYASIAASAICLLSSIIMTLVEKRIYQIALCLIPHIAFLYAIKLVLKMEKNLVGLKWKHFFGIYEEKSLGPLLCLVMFVIDTILYFLLCLYIEQINTGEYGISKKWYFPFQRSFWQSNSNSKSNDNARESGGANQNAGLYAQNLTKKFGDQYAVNNLSFVMNSNEITVMLGRNGAGKSTTILMLTGLLKPTSGTAIINGYDIRTDLSRARQSIGLCPQQNALFDNLSVKDHIIFFSRIKGVRGKADLKEQIAKYTDIMELDDKKSSLAKNLSGGMKRKLCLCCALCGYSKVVLCDEPSSGVDPAARRRLWKLLQSEKHSKAILLTTHFMDEAEALADHIVVLREGELKFEGSIFDMKKRFGQGYLLICDMDNDCSEEKVTKFLKRDVPSITLESQRGSVLIYRLPPDAIKNYVQLFRNLENNLQNLRLTGFGVNISTVEEVFKQLSADHDKSRSESKELQNYNVFSNELLIENSSGRRCQRLKGLFFKRKLILKRNWYCWLLIIILPALILLLIYLVSNFELSKELPAMPIDIRQYDKGESMLELSKTATKNSDEEKVASAYESYAKSFGSSYTLKSTNGAPFDEFLIATMLRNPDINITENLLIGATIGSKEMRAWHNPLYPHSIPLSVNFLHNAIARVQIGSDAMVSVTNAPLPFKKKDKIELRVQNYISMFLWIVTAIFVCYPVKERASGVKLQQYLAGVNIFQYWFTIYIVDFIKLILIILCMMLVCICIREENYNEVESCLCFLLIFILFALDILLWIYILSFIFQKQEVAFSVTIFLNFLISIVGEILLIMRLEEKYPILYCIRLIPIICLIASMENLNENSKLKTNCKLLQEQFKQDICSIEPNCCPIPHHFSSTKYGIGTELIYFLLGWFLLVFLLLLFESQLGLCLSSFCSACKCCGENSCLSSRKKEKRLKAGNQNKNNNVDHDKDDDVELEEERIRMMTKADARDLPLVVDRISKRYARFRAVRRLSFFVQDGECFGLLGVNGAGKTTTFKMLTGSAWINGGNAYIHGHGLKTYLKRSNSKIGYCPQNDSLFQDFTGREHLRLFSQLNGVRTSEIALLSYVLASRFDFIQHMDKKAKNLSGGNKRKLCTVIALLGNPEVIFLDEPSSGMDPLARRQLWNLVIQLCESGKPIVLTSHSMEECEALCTRLGIMVAGRLRCLGSTQHLKNKFSKGFVLKISIANTKKQDRQISTAYSTSISSSDPSFSESSLSEYTTSHDTSSEEAKTKNYRDNVIKFMENKLPQAELTEEYDHFLTYHVPKNIIKYSDMFELMEQNRKQLNIDDYSISQTTLDDIFIGFSNEEDK